MPVLRRNNSHKDKTMAYIPYYKPADGRLGNQANPGYGGMAAGAAANSLRTASQAMAFIQEKAGNQIEKINKIEDDGAASGYKIKVNDINAQLQAKIAADPFAFDKHLKWADDAAAKIRELKPTFNNPELAARYGGNQQEEDAQVLLINTAKGVQVGRIQVAGRNARALTDMYIKQGNYDAAVESTKSNPTLTEDESQAQSWEIYGMKEFNDMRNLINISPQEAAKRLNDPSDLTYLTLQQRNALESSLAQYRKANEEKIYKDNKSGKLTPEMVRDGVNNGFIRIGDANILMLQASGRMDFAYPIMQRKARYEANAAPDPILPNGKPNPEFEDWAGQFTTRWKGLNLSEKDIGNIINGMKDVDPEHPDIDVTGLLRIARESGNLNKNYSPYKDNGGTLLMRYKDGEKVPLMDEKGEKRKDAAGNPVLSNRYMLSEQEAYENEQWVDVKFREWRQTTEGRMASPAMQDKKIRELIGARTGKYFSHVTVQNFGNRDEQQKSLAYMRWGRERSRQYAKSSIDLENDAMMEAAKSYAARTASIDMKYTKINENVQSKGVLVSPDIAMSLPESVRRDVASGKVKLEDAVSGAEITMTTSDGYRIKTRIVGVDKSLVNGQISFGTLEANERCYTNGSKPSLNGAVITIPKDRSMPPGYKKVGIINSEDDRLKGADAGLVPIDQTGMPYGGTMDPDDPSLLPPLEEEVELAQQMSDFR